VTSPWLNTADACHYLRLVDAKTGAPKLKALYEFLARYQVKTWTRGGRSILIHKDDLDAALKPRPIGPHGPTDRTATKATHLSSPRGLGNVAPVGPIASFDATSTGERTVARPEARGNTPVTSGVHHESATCAGNSRRSA
jgi:Cu/Zn superoxide dismutase